MTSLDSIQAAGNRAIASLLRPTPVQREVPAGPADMTGPKDVTGPSETGAGAPREAPPTLRRGSSGDDVRTVQAVLVAQGWPVSIDGELGAETAAYLCLLQHRWQIDVNGTVDRDTWAAVQAQLEPGGDAGAESSPVVKEAGAWAGGAGPSTESATLAATVAALDNGPTVQREDRGEDGDDSGGERPATLPTVGPGSTGPDVKLIQAGLQLAFPRAGIAPDGVFGDATEAYVRLYQHDHGLLADGIVGPATRIHLDPVLSMERHAGAAKEMASIAEDVDAMSVEERASALPDLMPKWAADSQTLGERDF